jgi:fucose permease
MAVVAPAASRLPGRGHDRTVLVALFAVFGVMFGVWQVLLTDLSRALDLSPGVLGASLSSGFIASLPTMVLAGRGVDRWGRRRMIAGAGIVMAGVWLGFAVVGGAAFLVVLLLVYYSSTGVYDVGINATAIGVEQRSGRQIMSLAHGSFSGGGALGALSAGGLVAAGVPFRWLYVGVATLLAGAMLLTRMLSLDERPAPVKAGSRPVSDRFGLFQSRPLLLLAALTALGFLFEGIMETWSPIYLRSSLSLGVLIGASGVAIFHLAMMVGRFVSSVAIHRFGRRRTLELAGVVSAAGLVAALATEQTVPILGGLLIVGLSLAAVAPITFSLAGDEAGDRLGEASAVVTTIGYGGFLIGPAMVGGLAEATGLRLALAVGCLVGLLITLLSRYVHERPRPV